MLSKLLALFRLCSHRTLIRMHVEGVWYFVCECGYRTPILTPRKKRDA